MSNIIVRFLVVFLAMEELSATEGMYMSKEIEFSEYLSNVVNEIADQVDAELLLCINLNWTETNENINGILKKSTNMTKLIITKDSRETDFQILPEFKSKVLTIAFVTLRNMLQVQLKVKKVLWRLHYTDVIFVFEATEGISSDKVGAADMEQTLYKLFAECWQNGFTHVLAVYGNRNNLYTYHPFPRLRVVRLPHLLSYNIKTHLENFQGYKLRSPISKSSPRCYRYIDRNGSIAIAGSFYKIVRMFIEHHNGTFEQIAMPTYDLNFKDILDAFAARKIDIVANLFYINENYSRSHVLRHFKVFVMAPFAKPIPEYLYLIRPFASALWILIVATFLYAVSMITWIHWRQENVLDFGTTFLEVLKTMLFLPQNRYRTRTPIQIFIFVMLLLVGFLLTNFYVAKLSSLLTTDVYGPQINTFDDIARTDLLLPQTDVDLKYLRTLSHIHPSILDHIWETTPKIVHDLRRDLNTSFLHSGVEDKINFFLYQQKFLKVQVFRKIEQVLYVLPVFIPLPHGSPFILQLNRFLRRISDTGIIFKMIRDNEEDGILNGEIQFFRSDSYDDHTLTLTNLALVYLALGVGFSIAITSFVFELIASRHPLLDVQR